MLEITFHAMPRTREAAKGNIPRMIYQTFNTRRVPQRMLQAVDSWKGTNPEFGYEFFDDGQVLSFASQFPCTDFTFTTDTLMAAMRRIKPGAGKADLFRYLLIYQRGGVYVDIDTVCLVPLVQYIAARDDVVTGLGVRGDFHQFGLMYSPKHPFLKQAIENAVANILQGRFVVGFENSLEGLCGPPCLDQSIKQVLGIPPQSRFQSGLFQVSTQTERWQIRVLEGDLFGGRVAFKYPGYEQDLDAVGLKYWPQEPLFNDC